MKSQSSNVRESTKSLVPLREFPQGGKDTGEERSTNRHTQVSIKNLM